MVYSHAMCLSFRQQQAIGSWVTRTPVQVALLILIIAVAALVFWYGRTRLDPQAFLVHGFLGIFVLNVLTAATIFFPLPGEAANVAAGAFLNPLAVALVAASGATLGEMTAYLAGYFGRRLIPAKYEGRHAKAQQWMHRYGGFAVFLFAFIPMLLYDLIGIVAGSTRYHVGRFAAATFAGRVLRYLVYAYAGFGLHHIFPLL